MAVVQTSPAADEASEDGCPAPGARTGQPTRPVLSRQQALHVSWLRRRADELDADAAKLAREAALMRDGADRIEGGTHG